MKRHIFSILMLFVSLATFATWQEGDVIYINGARYIDGTKWDLLGKPIYGDSILSKALEAALPKDRSEVTSNWSGYTAYWSIVKDKLYLDSICCECYAAANKKSYMVNIPSDTLHRIFRKYLDGKRIAATWYKGDIRLGQGPVIYYEHSAYNRNYKEEQIITIQHGKVTDVKVFHNYMVEGFTLEGFSHSNPSPSDVRKKFPLHTENYPELEGVKVIRFHVKDARIDATGHLVECQIDAEVRRDGKSEKVPALAAEMTKAMKAIYPWRVYFINGEYRPYGVKGFFIPYRLD